MRGVSARRCGQLRQTRTDHRRAALPPDADRDAWGRRLDETVVLVLPVIWTYEGIGRPILPGSGRRRRPSGPHP
jgi:hypothetical protein